MIDLQCPKCGNDEQWDLVPQGASGHTGILKIFNFSVKDIRAINKKNLGKKLLLAIEPKYFNYIKYDKSSNYKLEIQCHLLKCREIIVCEDIELKNDEDLLIKFWGVLNTANKSAAINSNSNYDDDDPINDAFIDEYGQDRY